MDRFFRGLGWTMGILLAVALLLRALLLQEWRIPDDPRLAASIAPSLAGGDLVLMLTRGTPGFGDLVRCKDPEDPQAFVIGRIAGLEGDVVETQGSLLVVNGTRYNSTTACDQSTLSVAHPNTGADIELRCEVIEMGGGWHYVAYFPRTSGPGRSSKTEVGAGMVYLVSDNRELHDDSRDFGLVERATCSGRIMFRVVGKNGWSDARSRMSYIR